MTGREKLKKAALGINIVMRDSLIADNVDERIARTYANIAQNNFFKGAECAVIEVCAWLRKTQPQETLPDTTIERLKKEFLED